MGRRIQQSTSTRSQAASARSELGPTTLTSPSMRLPPMPPVRARGRRLHMSTRSQQLANPTGRQEGAFTRLRDSSSASPTFATTDDQSNVATRSVTSRIEAYKCQAEKQIWFNGYVEEYDALNQVGARGLGHYVAPVGIQWKEQKWGDSFAKAYLKKSLLDDKSKIHSMTPAEVYLSHPSFACYPKDRFIANLANLKEALRIERERVAEEEKEFLREQSLYPRGKVTSRGKPFWDTHTGNNHSSGLKYEFAMSIRRPNLVWMRGPLPAGEMHDGTEVRPLRALSIGTDMNLNFLFLTGKKAIGDSGYSGIDNVTITREGHSREMKQWLGRAKNRQESLHSRIKSFNILKQRFRHGRKGTDDKLDLHRTCVEAVCVLVQYDMDCGNPVFDL
ncbi:hypothetical protein THAOC_32038 [Thalassiosira oceanica]|uniref:DDE Tnp4 domain-containing protein n=1 Tax=Thalassiosira oceanica TaxID=159749 RepID=K0R809_THAOC|nr:hypothetical protein THAOC_32038 [Thalassiosira oceanica]|eukprot:EJK49115.1 hypothetical protein THAOC_32038 [Thalassiosira oceanica]